MPYYPYCLLVQDKGCDSLSFHRFISLICTICVECDYIPSYCHTCISIKCIKMCKLWPCKILFYIFYLCKHEYGITLYNFVIFYHLLWKISIVCSCTILLFKVIFTCTRRFMMWPCTIWPTMDVHRPKKILSWVTAKHQHRGKISPTPFSYVNISIG